MEDVDEGWATGPRRKEDDEASGTLGRLGRLAPPHREPDAQRHRGQQERRQAGGLAGVRFRGRADVAGTQAGRLAAVSARAADVDVRQGDAEDAVHRGDV